MKRFVQRVNSILHNPSILPYYLLWLISSRHKVAARVQCFSSISFIDNWQSFSEFYSFRRGIPDREILFLQAVASSSQKPRLVIDVGANIGVFTLAFADIFDDAKVIAFEPSQRTYSRLERNLNASVFSKHVRLENIALSDVDGRVQFLDDPKSPATNHLVADLSEDHNLPNLPCVAVDCLKLNTYCESNSITHIDLLKIDVEGFECQVLEGARAVIERRAVTWIFLELCPSNLNAVGRSADCLWQTIASLQLAAYKITSSGRLSLISYDEFCGSSLANIVLTSCFHDHVNLIN